MGGPKLIHTSSSQCGQLCSSFCHLLPSLMHEAPSPSLRMSGDITEAWVASYSLTEPGDLDPWAVVMHAEKAAVAEKLMLSVNIRASRTGRC